MYTQVLTAICQFSKIANFLFSRDWTHYSNTDQKYIQLKPLINWRGRGRECERLNLNLQERIKLVNEVMIYDDQKQSGVSRMDVRVWA